MPRGFTDREKETIQARLLEHGRACLVTTGIVKTSIAEFTAAVGISKGAFYLFFPSKEALFSTIIEQAEAEFRAELLALAEGDDAPPAERVRRFLGHAFTLWRADPLFQRFDTGQFEALMRAVPPERVAAHQRSDDAFGAAVLAAWRATGLHIPWAPDEFIGLMRALFFVSLHADDIGPTYSATMERLIDLIADQIALMQPGVTYDRRA